MIVSKLHKKLDVLFEFLLELGDFQLKRQNSVDVLIKSDANLKNAWEANDVVSEVDLETEKRLLNFLKKEFGPIRVISEEFNAGQDATLNEDTLCFVVDPLDGTKPYLEGSKAFAINVGLLKGGTFMFAATCYPAFNTILYAFLDSETVLNQNHQPLIPVSQWNPECYISLAFYSLIRPEYKNTQKIKQALGVDVGEYPRCATYIMKRLIEGKSFAYMSKDVYLWDVGPSSLLLTKSACQLVDLQGNPPDFRKMSLYPFRHPALVALPIGEVEPFLLKLRDIL